MSADEIVLTADSTHALAVHSAVASSRRQPIFLIALSCAAAVHAALILGMISYAPRYMGEPDGNSRVINVELIDEADFKSRASVASPPGNSPSAPATRALPPRPEAGRPSEPTLPQKSADPPPLETKKPEVPLLPGSSAKRSATEFTPNYELKPPAQLDLRVPFNATTRSASSGPQGRSSAVARPPGITRSGENDKFGRDVIRSLKKTMPPPSGIKGRVTIRIFLDEKGYIARAELVQSGGNRELDQNVLFSAQQANFPYPPNGATVADRTFRVTYVYR